MYDNASLFKLAFNASSIGMALVDIDGKFVRVNASLCKLVGYSEVELITKTFQDITYSEDLPPDLALMNKCLTGEIDGYNLEKRYLTKDGKVVWILLTASLIRDEENKPVVFIAHIQDITEIKMHKERLDAALSNWGIGLWTWYAEKDELIWDKTMFELYGVDPQKFVPTYAFFEQFLHKDDKESVATAVAEAVSKKIDFHTQFRIVRPDKTVRWILAKGRATVDSLGNVSMMTGINQDVTTEMHEKSELDLLSSIIAYKAEILAEGDRGKKP
jgi:PAS domain S-box-containing protein